jgi:DNA mismatch endonuclease (patch repair protein)
VLPNADNISKAARSRVMAAVKSKHTTPERMVRRIAHALGFRFRLHVRDLPGKPDLVFPRLRKIIDVRGCFWHLHQCERCRIPASRRDYWLTKLNRNAGRDKESLRQLRHAGWRVLIVWECQTQAKKIDGLRSKIKQFLED